MGTGEAGSRPGKRREERVRRKALKKRKEKNVGSEEDVDQSRSVKEKVMRMRSSMEGRRINGELGKTQKDPRPAVTQ